MPQKARILIAVSGGVDSAVLLNLLTGWRKLLRVDLAVAHVHHGQIRGPQGAFRRRAAEWAYARAQELEVPFFFNGEFSSKGRLVAVQNPPQVLKSEESLRRFRWHSLNAWREQWRSGALIATAHSADDQLETQILRLLRGTGIQGIKGMGVRDGHILRPLLYATKREILAEANERKLEWLEDPSNRRTDAFRNWVRGSWLKALDERDPSLVGNLARSLARVSQVEKSPALWKGIFLKDRIRRCRLLELPLGEQKRALAHYLRRSGFLSYTEGHIAEVLKRLDTDRSDFTFKLLGRRWEVDSHYIRQV